MSDSVFHRVEPDDPTRCQTTHAGQQCPFRAVEGGRYCARHSGASGNAEKKETARKYMVARWQESIAYQADHPEIKNLNEELGILRMTLQRRLEQCQDDQMLLMYSSQISNLIRDITLVADKWHKIQMQTNAVMDRQQAMSFIDALTGIITKYIQDADTLKSISDDMVADLNRRINYSIK